MSELILYFDESGFTGENLLSDDQKTFAYGSINIDPERAENLVSHIIQKYKIQNGELKGVKLIRREKGRQAILEIIDEVVQDVKVSVSDKKYALAAHFFEYVFEPVLAEKNSIFYDLEFHKYIANVLYISFINNDDLAKQILPIFEKLMRKKDLSHLNEIIALVNSFPDESEELDFFKKILSFVDAHKDIIYEEIKTLPPWTLDLSLTSLHSLFCEWGVAGKEMRAFCDSSKPIEAKQDFFSNFIGRKDIVYSHFSKHAGKPMLITYNLKEINLVDSKEHPGVQLADIVATASTYSFQMFEASDEFAEQIREKLLPRLVYASVFPDFDYINFEKKEVQLNALIFEELIGRTKAGIPILEDIEGYIVHMQVLLETNPIDLKHV